MTCYLHSLSFSISLSFSTLTAYLWVFSSLFRNAVFLVSLSFSVSFYPLTTYLWMFSSLFSNAVFRIRFGTANLLRIYILIHLPTLTNFRLRCVRRKFINPNLIKKNIQYIFYIKKEIVSIIFSWIIIYLYFDSSKSTSSRLEIISGTFRVLYSMSGAKHFAYT